MVLASRPMAFRDVAVSAVVAAVVAAGTTFALQRTGLSREAVEVPSVLGLPTQSARELIESRGLMFVVGAEREDSKAPAGNIIAQRPLDGSRIERGQAVDVTVAKAPALGKAPALVGLPLGEAKLRIEMAKLALGKIAEENSADVKEGNVVSQSVPEGNEAKVGTAIDLVVSKGVATIPVPSVVGRALSKAKEELQKAGFTVGNLRSRSDEDHSDGLILEQSPAANQQAPKGSPVDLVVNRT
jgi:beta-lactam-binding protein with PASTA domain